MPHFITYSNSMRLSQFSTRWRQGFWGFSMWLRHRLPPVSTAVYAFLTSKHAILVILPKNR